MERERLLNIELQLNRRPPRAINVEPLVKVLIARTSSGQSFGEGPDGRERCLHYVVASLIDYAPARTGHVDGRQSFVSLR